jgi:hypothetical protein
VAFALYPSGNQSLQVVRYQRKFLREENLRAKIWNPHPTKRHQLPSGSVALLASGCTVGPEFSDPEIDLAGQFFGTRLSAPVTFMVARWWEAFGNLWRAIWISFGFRMQNGHFCLQKTHWRWIAAIWRLITYRSTSR